MGGCVVGFDGWVDGWVCGCVGWCVVGWMVDG